MKKNFMFNINDTQKYKYLNLRSPDILCEITFDDWNKSELLQLIDLYYQYFNENKDSDFLMDISEYVVSGRYKKDRNE